MSVLELVAALVVGGLVGSMIGYLARSRNVGDLRVKLAAALSSIERLPQVEASARQLQSERDDLVQRLAKAHGDLDTEQKTHQIRLEELQRHAAELENRFFILANQALGRNAEFLLTRVAERMEKHDLESKATLQERQTAFDSLVKPIGASLTKFEEHVRELETTREKAFSEIQTQMTMMVQSQDGLRTETAQLVTALRQPKVRGRWGEMQLRKVLEMCGMLEHVDFSDQRAVETEESFVRPDVVIHLSGGKSVVVDAKTPMDAYLAALDASNDADKEECLLRHAKQVRTHISQLGNKEYWKALPGNPDFVVMFIPSEVFLAPVIDRYPDLFEEALKHQVLVCTPVTLIALLKAIAYGWQQEDLSKNAKEIEDLARQIFDRVRVFSGHLGDLGKALRNATGRYNNAVGSLEGRVLPLVRRFEVLKVATGGRPIVTLQPIDREPRQPLVEVGADDSADHMEALP